METLTTDSLIAQELARSYNSVLFMDYIIKFDSQSLTSGTAHTFSLDSLADWCNRLFFNNLTNIYDLAQVSIHKLELVLYGRKISGERTNSQQFMKYWNIIHGVADYATYNNWINFYSFSPQQKLINSKHHFGEINSETFWVFNCNVTQRSSETILCSIVTFQHKVLSIMGIKMLRIADA